MKKKIPKIILILSFAPYAVSLGYGIYSAIYNCIISLSTSNVFTHFGAALIMLAVLCSYPVIPICLIYQLVYLAVSVMKKHNVSKKKMWIVLVLITLLIVYLYIKSEIWSFWLHLY